MSIVKNVKLSMKGLVHHIIAFFKYPIISSQEIKLILTLKKETH